MKVHFITDAGRHVAGARFRAWWPAEAWNDPDVTCGPIDDPRSRTADAVVLTRLIGQPTSFVTDAKVVIWDLADPIWCWMGDKAFLELAKRMSGLTVSSDGLKRELKQSFDLDAMVIPDRLPYQAGQRVHENVEAPTIVWFGYGFNRYPALAGVGPLLKRLRVNGIKFKLQIIDDLPGVPTWGNDRYGLDAVTSYLPWDLDLMHERLCQADIALLPPFPGWVGTVKSDNRATTAAWAGLPIVNADHCALAGLLGDVGMRRLEGDKVRAYAEACGDVRRSVQQWRALLAPALTCA